MEPINPDFLPLPPEIAARSAAGVALPVIDGNTAKFPQQPTAVAVADLRSLGLLFGAIYFLQTIANPLDGLATQPVRGLLKALHERPSDITAFTALISLPWTLKPLYGLLTDFLPLAGSRRKSYLMVTSIAVSLGFFAYTGFRRRRLTTAGYCRRWRYPPSAPRLPMSSWMP